MKALIVLFITGILALFAGLGGNRRMINFVVIFGTIAALGLTLLDLAVGDTTGLNEQFSLMIHFDRNALAFSATTLATLLLLLGLSTGGLRGLHATLGDNYGLLLFSACGALIMYSFTNVVMLFLGIEILSIPLYVLAGSRRDDLASNEAALKYFLMGSFATGILLFGIALLYGGSGSFDVKEISMAISDGRHSAGMLHTGILLVMVGLGFKVSAAPFHFWAPDVYTGSPNLVTAFMATIVKTAGFAAFFFLFQKGFLGAIGFWSVPLAALAALTMTLANVTAIWQQNFKRMMAYSSISHAGYLLLGILAADSDGSGGAILLYTFTYSIATICAFAIYMVVSEPNNDGGFSAFNGLSKKEPVLAAVMAIAMLSLAGIPPTAGFFGKYFLFAEATEKYPWLVVLAVINSAISIYYYFKIIIAMYFSREENAYTVERSGIVRWVALAGVAVIALLTIFPGEIYKLIQ